jgi:predicted DNA-binding protein (MmcQ/YjbR family)
MLVSIESIREYCLKKKGNVSEELPFGEDELAFKVEGKIFLLTRLERRPLSINLKCDPAHAIELREKYESIQPGYHMNKRHWNTIILDGTIPSNEVFKMIDHSYEEVVSILPTKLRKRLLQK